MSQTDLERPLEAEALREIERSLHGKLKAHRLSDSFIERCGEEAVQRGLVEYLHAVEEGIEVDNRDAFVVRAAFWRAIDELRREARQADGTAIEAILASGRIAEPASEELAVERLAAEELREAVESLSAEERQVLSLHYFEQLSFKRSAETLYCSERTFRRRLKKALGNLSRHLGVAAPEPGSELAIEIGLVAWVSLCGARVVLSQGPLAQLAAVPDAVHDGVLWTAGRLRDLTVRLFASGAGERATEIAASPLTKTGGACTGALAICALTGVVGPGLGGVDVIGGHERLKRPMTRSHQPAPAHPDGAVADRGIPTAASTPRSSTKGSASPPPGKARRTEAASAKREARQVRQQTDGFARAASESTTSAPPAAPETPISSRAEAPTEVPSPTPDSSSGNTPSQEAEQAEQEFGAFR
jgi:RNA polymerase sigma factor (sigma-70 family)